MNELRQYEPWECGTDGYPFAWHGRCTCDQVSVLDATDMCFYTTCSADAPAIKDAIREEAQNRCERCWHPYSKGEGEWSMCDGQCRHAGPVQMWTTEGWTDFSPADGRTYNAALAVSQGRARWRILTVHHLDEDKANCRWWNLVALCQRCHLRMQHGVVMGTPYHYEHSVWFQPYAAAFYAWKYLGQDLARTEVMQRMDELLSLELQGSQESLW